MFGLEPTITFGYQRPRKLPVPTFWRSLSDAEADVLRDGDGALEWDREESAVAIRAVLRHRLGAKAASAIARFGVAIEEGSRRAAQSEDLITAIARLRSLPIAAWTADHHAEFRLLKHRMGTMDQDGVRYLYTLPQRAKEYWQDLVDYTKTGESRGKPTKKRKRK